jgi:hypothetical protein
MCGTGGTGCAALHGGGCGGVGCGLKRLRKAYWGCSSVSFTVGLSRTRCEQNTLTFTLTHDGAWTMPAAEADAADREVAA